MGTKQREPGTIFQLSDLRDETLAEMVADAERDLTRPHLHRWMRVQRQRLIAKCRPIMEARATMRDLYGAREDGTNVEFVHREFQVPPSYDLTVRLDHASWEAGRPHIFDWEAMRALAGEGR